MADNLIKFKRGSQAAYDALKLADRVDPDTLYFIYDKNAKDFPGFLYLGITPIAGFGDAPGSIDTISLIDGEDIDTVLEERYDDPQVGDLCIVDGNLYIYNGEDWVSIYEYIGYPASGNEPATGVYADIEALEKALNGDGDSTPYGITDQQTGDTRNVIDDLLAIIDALGGMNEIEGASNIIQTVNTLISGGTVLYWEEIE